MNASLSRVSLYGLTLIVCDGRRWHLIGGGGEDPNTGTLAPPDHPEPGRTWVSMRRNLSTIGAVDDNGQLWTFRMRHRDGQVRFTTGNLHGDAGVAATFTGRDDTVLHADGTIRVRQPVGPRGDALVRFFAQGGEWQTLRWDGGSRVAVRADGTIWAWSADEGAHMVDFDHGAVRVAVPARGGLIVVDVDGRLWLPVPVGRWASVDELPPVVDAGMWGDGGAVAVDADGHLWSIPGRDGRPIGAPVQATDGPPVSSWQSTWAGWAATDMSGRLIVAGLERHLLGPHDRGVVVGEVGTPRFALTRELALEVGWDAAWAATGRLAA